MGNRQMSRFKAVLGVLNEKITVNGTFRVLLLFKTVVYTLRLPKFSPFQIIQLPAWLARVDEKLVAHLGSKIEF